MQFSAHHVVPLRHLALQPSLNASRRWGVWGGWGVQFCWMQFCNGHGIAALHFCASALLRTVVRCTILRCRAVRCTFERCRAFRDALFSWGGSPVQLQTAFPDHQHQIWKMVIAHRAEDDLPLVIVRSGHQLFYHIEFWSPKVIRLPHTLPALDEISIIILYLADLTDLNCDVGGLTQLLQCFPSTFPHK